MTQVMHGQVFGCVVMSTGCLLPAVLGACGLFALISRLDLLGRLLLLPAKFVGREIRLPAFLGEVLSGHDGSWSLVEEQKCKQNIPAS